MRRKKSKKTYVITMILFVYILFLSVGYAFFSESLTINGVASTVDYYEGTKLPVTSVVRNTSNNYYFTSDFSSDYLISFQSESWQDDTYILNIDKTLLASLEGQMITYTISFINPTVLNYTNGVISTEVIGDSSDIVLTEGSLSATEVEPNGMVDVSFEIKVDSFNSSDSSAKATITYTYQNKTRYLYFIVNYKGSSNYENIFNQESLLESTFVSKSDNGYIINGYPVIYKTTNTLVQELKSKLKAGVTYELIRDYKGVTSNSNGSIRIRDASTNLVNVYYGNGIKSTQFSLTQEQIDSIQYIYIYSARDGTGIFKYIIIREVK